MSLHDLAGQPAPASLLVDVPSLIAAYYSYRPDPALPGQLVAFGTSGHRGTSLRRSFNEAHILAISQAIADYRKQGGIDGPLFLGRDTHALSTPAQMTALEVLAANDVEVRVARDEGYTPTPVISHAILTHNRDCQSGLADGIVITPSHNPPDYGGFKYNPPHGGPADTGVTSWIAARANELMGGDNREVQRFAFEKAMASSNIRQHDYIEA
ncbi:MAG: alpha-D-glucose phosphate-specific phosphoglucomutase, partial [Thermoanaerobaculia bacterium]